MKETYKQNDQIVGVQIGLNLDCRFFTDTPIDNKKDELKLKEAVGNFQHEVQNVIESAFARTNLDSIATDFAFIDYITFGNIDNFVDYEIIKE